jgi:hypothetical protein
MREVVAKRWDELPAIWHGLYDRNNAATTFQSYEFLTFTGRGKPQRKDLFRLIGVREWNLVLYRDGEAVAIAPLLVKKKRGRTTVYLRGHFTVANQIDFIYADWSYDDFKFLMDYIKERLGQVSFFLDRVSERTVTCQYLKQYFADKNIEEYDCFAIPVPDDYDEWWRGLSRSTKQNINTHRNRLKRNNLDFSFRFVYGEKLDRSLCCRMMWVYADRFLVKNGLYLGPLRRPVTWALRAFLLRDKMTRWMNREDGNFHAVMFVGGEVAAFLSGLIFKDKRLLASRLNINTKYVWYSPGNLLVSATMQHIIEQNRAGAMDIKELDLSQGGDDGMAYKRVLGGKVHHTYVFYD